MKTERRHDLETNELARKVTRWIETIKPYSTQLVGGAVLVLGIAFMSSMWGSISQSKEQAAWDAYVLAFNFTGGDIELMGLQKVANDEAYEGTAMQEWAYVTWADRQLILASHAYLIDRDSAQDRLRRVLGIYEQLASGAGDTNVMNRARFGLARVYEMQGKVEEARSQYALVEGELESIAADRATQLESESAQEAIAWLASAELPRRNLQNAPGVPGSRPEFNAPLPSASPPSSGLGTRSLQDVLGEFGDESAADDRYSSEDSSSEPAEDSPADDSPADDGTEQ